MSDKDLTPADLNEAASIMDQYVRVKRNTPLSISQRVRGLVIQAKGYKIMMEKENINPADYFSDYEPEAQAEGGKEEVLFRDKIMARLHNAKVSIADYISKVKVRLHKHTEITKAFMSFYYDNVKFKVSVYIAEMYVKVKPKVDEVRNHAYFLKERVLYGIAKHRPIAFIVSTLLATLGGLALAILTITFLTWMGASALTVGILANLVGGITAFIFGWMIGEDFERRHRLVAHINA